MLTCVFSLVRQPLATSTVDGDRRWVMWPATLSVGVRGPDRAWSISGRRQSGNTWAGPHASGGLFRHAVVHMADSVDKLNAVVFCMIRCKVPQRNA